MQQEEQDKKLKKTRCAATATGKQENFDRPCGTRVSSTRYACRLAPSTVDGFSKKQSRNNSHEFLSHKEHPVRAKRKWRVKELPSGDDQDNIE